MVAIPGLENQTELIGTTINWEIKGKNDSTELNLTHLGLHPKIECYKICTDGWKQFIGSLKSYVEAGKGDPFLK